MNVFAAKLANLAETVRLADTSHINGVAQALREGFGRPAVAVGSGGSAITADFFARCRSTLGQGITLVQTPMEFVLAQENWAGFDIWLFSAGANNPDVAAALSAALASDATNIRLLTVNPDGATTVEAGQHGRAQVMLAPVAEKKDGFLATHSLIAMVTSLLAASDVVGNGTSGSAIIERYAEETASIVSQVHKAAGDFRPGDTVFLLHDPQCHTIATVIETSLWETGIAPVQSADFRNFAHGRHVWAARHPDTMFILSITTTLSRDVWNGIRRALPESIRSADLDLGHAGRFATALSVVEGLTIVLALGDATGTDPGKPGRGDFAPAIYEHPGLANLTETLTPSVRHKLEAVHQHDDPLCPQSRADEACSRWLSSLSDARIGALVLDYDGTVVTTEDRLSPPESSVIDELTRLADGGIGIAIATGRGGSAGEALRNALPGRLHPSVTVGYYNGGHIRPLNINIDDDKPAADPALAAVADWIEERQLLQSGIRLKRGAVQIVINHSDVRLPFDFIHQLATCPPIQDGSIKVRSSHHSFDLFPVATSKVSVCAQMQQAMASDSKVLAIGDSGGPGGNDNELLADYPSISVDGVCGHLAGSWSLFGRRHSGPSALLMILRALRIENGHARFDLESLGMKLA